VFEVGKFYRFKMWEPGSNGGTITEYVPCKILEVDCLPSLRKRQRGALAFGAGARAARLSGARAVTLTFGVGSRRQHQLRSRWVGWIGADDGFAALSGLLVDLIGGVPVVLEFLAVRLDAEIGNFAARLAGPRLRLVQPSEDHGVSAGETERPLVEHGDGHGG
jgi:hypothetical protein